MEKLLHTAKKLVIFFLSLQTYPKKVVGGRDRFSTPGNLIYVSLRCFEGNGAGLARG